jgi:membrane protein implicated in regulation of membrane protease activity
MEVNTMTWITWCAIAVVLIILEVVTMSVFFFTCLAIGAASAAIASYFGGSVTIEVIIFITSSILSLYLIRPIFKKMMSKSDTVSSNIDALIGANAIVTEKITPFKTGLVKVFSEVWRAEADVEIKAGDTVKVEKVTGTTLAVKKL